MFTTQPCGEAVTLVNSMGQYRNGRFDRPLLGRLIHHFRVLPRYDPLIVNHLAEVKRRRRAPADAHPCGIPAWPSSFA